MTVKIERRLHLFREKTGLAAFVCVTQEGALEALLLERQAPDKTGEWMRLSREEITELRDFLKLAQEFDQ